MPDWYPLLRTARYARVPAWELVRQPWWWTQMYETARQAEEEAG